MVASILTLLSILLATGSCAEPGENGASPSDLRRALFANYDRLVRPVADARTQVPLKADLNPIYIRELDEQREILVMDGWISMRWKDEKLVWDPEAYGGIKVLNIPSSELWLPDLTIYGASPDNRLLPRVFTNAIVNYTGDVIWVPPLTVQSRCPLELSGFPNDRQLCIIRMGSWTYGSSQMDLQLNTQRVSLDNWADNNPEWRLLSATVERKDNYYPCCVDSYPTLNYNLTIGRRTPAPVFIANALVQLACVLGLLPFWLPPDSACKLVVGAIAEVLLTMTLFYLSLSLPSPGTRLQAGNRVYPSMCLVAVAMLVEVFIVNLARMMGPCRPPRCLLRMADSCCQTLCVCVSRPYPGGDLTAEVLHPSGKLKKRVPSAQEEWNLVAMASDRFLFIVGVIGCVIVHTFL